MGIQAGTLAIAPIAISIVSALISAFSALTAVRQSRLARRTRLGQLVDEITKADLEFDRYLADHDDEVPEAYVNGFNDRQEILARQALALLTSFRRRGSTSREIDAVANALEHIGDYKNAEGLYRRAVKVGAREGRTYESLAQERYGIFLFKADRPTEGSTCLAEAAELLDETAGDRIRRRKFAALAMRAMMHGRYGHDLDTARQLIEQCRALAAEVRLEDFRVEMQDDLRDYEKQHREHQAALLKGVAGSSTPARRRAGRLR